MGWICIMKIAHQNNWRYAASIESKLLMVSVLSSSRSLNIMCQFHEVAIFITWMWIKDKISSVIVDHYECTSEGNTALLDIFVGVVQGGGRFQSFGNFCQLWWLNLPERMGRPKGVGDRFHCLCRACRAIPTGSCVLNCWKEHPPLSSAVSDLPSGIFLVIAERGFS